MPDSFTANLNLCKPEVGVNKDHWGDAPAGLNGDMDKIDAVFMADGSGTPVGLNIGTGKVLDATDGTILATADRFELSDATDPTKLAHILLNGLATGVHNNYSLPPIADTLVGLTQAQNLSSKTTTDPVPADNTQAIVSAHWVNAAVSAAIATAIANYSAFNPGDIIASAAPTKAGWITLVGGTIGDATSGGTVRANADTRALFTLFWNINGATWPINGGRTTSADADFDLHKTVTLPDARGMALVGLGGTINLTTLFATTGAATVALSEANLAPHHHDVAISLQTMGASGGGSALLAEMPGGVTSSTTTGSGTPHANVQPSIGVVYWIKL